jgi:NAD(P)-dependent dehydrogenase (short-subunit alcohol dehydrogenase family)
MIMTVEANGGKCLPIQCDLRDEEQLKSAIQKAVQHFGGLDALVNNASAISLTGRSAQNTPFLRIFFKNLFSLKPKVRNRRR